ncbi:MAG: replication-associated recombination protein A [Spirochaetes bacterium]|nr:replication-associated recombination protein A [Spirochaetota bacterium]MBN2769648.1 replication-associated recombination protein A [Spirochaetota bacterium]
MTLFNDNSSLVPLAERCRPHTLKKYIGQLHLVDNDKILFRMIEEKRLFSMILWGPPGCGKTTLARIISDTLNLDPHYLSAVSAGVADVRKIIEKGRTNRLHGIASLLFLDEIHRFNKAQQDSILQAVESGDIVLIGATTENPSFSIIPPLLSRARVFKLEPLKTGELRSILDNAIKNDSLLKIYDIADNLRDEIVKGGGGDARKMFNLLESACALSLGQTLTVDAVEQAVAASSYYYDRSGERHYDTISAFIKSIRGSDPDATIYYLARMLNGGEDPLYIARRMVVHAAEDIGNASPTALTIAVSTMTAVKNIGMPEARIVLSQCALFLASSPKSNASCMAIDEALDFVKSDVAQIPMHIRNAPTKLMEEFGYHKGYKYPHDYPGNFVQENYFPEELKDKVFYNPSENGSEKSIKERLAQLWPRRNRKG